MNQNTNTKIGSKIQEDLSPTRNLTGLHLKIVVAIAIYGPYFNFGMHPLFHFGLILECLKVYRRGLFI